MMDLILVMKQGTKHSNNLWAIESFAERAIALKEKVLTNTPKYVMSFKNFDLCSAIGPVLRMSTFSATWNAEKMSVRRFV